MNKWENARILIDAKKHIDTLMYIRENEKDLSNVDLPNRIKTVYKQFYIECCNLLDKACNQTKKELIKDGIVKAIYYERDKFASHRDNDYKQPTCNPDEIIDNMKKQIKKVKELCNDNLPEVLTLDFVPHDRTLFRYLNGVTTEIEEDIYRLKNPNGRFHSYQLSEIGQFLFKKYDTSEVDRRRAKVLGYDYDEAVHWYRENMKKQDDETMTIGDLLIRRNGLNIYEGIQNYQDFYIKYNQMYDANLWYICPQNYIEKLNRLKMMGIYDKFEIFDASKLADKEVMREVQEIINK